MTRAPYVELPLPGANGRQPVGFCAPSGGIENPWVSIAEYLARAVEGLPNRGNLALGQHLVDDEHVSFHAAVQAVFRGVEDITVVGLQ